MIKLLWQFVIVAFFVGTIHIYVVSSGGVQRDNIKNERVPANINNQSENYLRAHAACVNSLKEREIAANHGEKE